ncbi:hypothetical protein SAMN05443252_10479 [Bacillus sp. OV322]|uniref:hypothetical protein n=1 Tax=Bacillus sp. OV322 TaxID=1882764 RepID=UPI0008F203AB|nr:hypothetical protein [Bacillus sp. OV322]SFC52081.1 hypothetical protein SAMN05443252_10479 [Bacillus sp. OV322]
MLMLIGVLAGITVSIIGSLFFGMIPAFWFFTLFKLTIIPSILVFIVLTYKIKPTFNQSTNWLYSFCSLLIITL